MPSVDLRYLDWKVVYLEEQRRGRPDTLSRSAGSGTITNPRRFRRGYHVRSFLRAVRWNDKHGAYDAHPQRAT